MDAILHYICKAAHMISIRHLVIVSVIPVFLLLSCNNVVFYESPDHDSVLNTNYDESCLSIKEEYRPVWECYEVVLGPEADRTTVYIKHASGDRHHVVSFNKDNRQRFRFTPTKKGRWCFNQTKKSYNKHEETCIDINAPKPTYANGFVAADGNKWIRTATGKAFVPQYVMYDKPALEAGINQFIIDHGFTGFHIIHLRDFLENPEYFEAVVLKTYRAGGVTHFWLWADASREKTPTTYGVDVDELYNEIIARLAPIPGWTLGYGFDLFEWVTEGEVSKLRERMHTKTSYRHLIGARGYKNEYREVDKNLDYASWEWHRPTYADYRRHIANAEGRPAFSEDRFRIRPASKHGYKNYNFDMTRRGLWHSLFAGGVANIWGYQKGNGEFSSPYPNKDQLLIYRQFADKYFTRQSGVIAPYFADAVCLRVNTNNVSDACYIEDVDNITFNQNMPDAQKLLVIDVKKSAQEVPVSVDDKSRLRLPKKSDWVVLIQ
jgi:hypothetical protein